MVGDLTNLENLLETTPLIPALRGRLCSGLMLLFSVHRVSLSPFALPCGPFHLLSISGLGFLCI